MVGRHPHIPEACHVRRTVFQAGCLDCTVLWLQGSIPDMHASTQLYLELQRVYREKAEDDASQGEPGVVNYTPHPRLRNPVQTIPVVVADTNMSHAANPASCKLR